MLLGIGLTHLKACNLGNGIWFIRWLQRASQEILFTYRLGTLPRINT
jgi:hypothetical protein